MALPTKDKTYNYTQINQAVLAQGSNLATNRRYLRTLVDALVALGTWVCVASSDGAGGFDAMTGPSTAQASRWTDDSKLVWQSEGSNHSWIVLENIGAAAVGTAGNVQIKYDLKQNDGDGWECWCSLSTTGTFTGGTATAAPAASDASEVNVALYSYYSDYLSFPGNQNTQLHVWGSTDGEVTHIVGAAAGRIFAHAMIVKAKDPVATNWAAPWLGLRHFGSCPNGAAAASNTDEAYFMTHMGAPGTTGPMYLTGETIYRPGDGIRYSVWSSNVADEDTTEWPLCQVGLYSGFVGHRGRKGLLFDVYFGLRTAYHGATYVNGLGQKEWVQIGDFVLPWTNIAMEMT